RCLVGSEMCIRDRGRDGGIEARTAFPVPREGFPSALFRIGSCVRHDDVESGVPAGCDPGRGGVRCAEASAQESNAGEEYK
ncbi:MAG: hypothetical protein QUS33_05550, partial [Dehalococcoidia bacterium]|nr:hypothetical protein [Dehalococcoidia bacterium]